MSGPVGSPPDLQKTEEDDHQVHMIEDDLQAPGEVDGLLGQMAGDSRPVLKEVLMGDLLGQVGDHLEDSWNVASEDSLRGPQGGSCSDPGGLRCIHILGLHLVLSRAASEDRSQGHILS